MTQSGETPIRYYFRFSFEQRVPFPNHHFQSRANRTMEQTDMERAIAFCFAIQAFIL